MLLKPEYSVFQFTPGSVHEVSKSYRHIHSGQEQTIFPNLRAQLLRATEGIAYLSQLGKHGTTQTSACAGVLPGCHLMLQPMLGVTLAAGSFPASKLSIAFLTSSPARRCS